MSQGELTLKHGHKGGPFDGRIFVQPRSNQRQLHLALALIQAEMRGTAYLLPEGREDRCIAALREAVSADIRNAAGDMSEAEYQAGCQMLEMKLTVKRCSVSLADKARAAARKQLETMSSAERAVFAAQLSRSPAVSHQAV